ncbi:MAG: hypothetical protein E5V81_04195, partial [Mesorhizobium sp.]
MATVMKKGAAKRPLRGQIGKRMPGRSGSIATEAPPVASLGKPDSPRISLFGPAENAEFLATVNGAASGVDLGARTPGETHGLTQRLSHASLWAFFIYMAGAALTFVTQVAIARMVGPASYGIYAYVFAWIALLSYGATLGFHVAVMR